MNEAPTLAKAYGASKIEQNNFKARSTSVEAQRERIIVALRERPQTSYDLRCLGIYQAPARIKELRDRFGFVIRTETVTLYDRDGFIHPNAGRYHLDGEPLDGYVPEPASTAANALREAAKVMRAQAKGLERNSIKREHIPHVRQRVLEALRVLVALEQEGAAEGTHDAQSST